MSDQIKNILYIVIALATIVGMALGANAHFAKQKEFEKLASRLDQKIKADQIYDTKRSLWALYGKHRTKDCNRMPEPDRTICRDLRHTLEMLTGKRN